MSFQLPASSSGLSASGFQLPASGLFACLRLATESGTPAAGSRPLHALLAVARDFSPRVRQVGACEVLLDVSGLGRLIGPPPEIARQLARAIAEAGPGVNDANDANVANVANVAIAPTMTVARLLATRSFCDAVHDGSDDAIARFHELPVTLLEPLEVLPPATNDRDRARAYETLARWGIATLGDLAELPPAELSSRLGRRGVALQRLAQGLDPAPFVPDAETPRFAERLELEWPIDALEPLSFVFARLLEPLSASLERADRGAAAVRLDLRLTDRSTDARVLQLPAPMRDPRVLRTLLLLDLDARPPAGAIDVVAIEVDPAPSRITQFSLLQRALPSPETLSTLTARLSALVGDARVGSAVLLDSHRPDAFAMARYAPEERGRTGARGAQGAWGARGAEGAEMRGAAAEARSATVGAHVLRRQRNPVAIRVSVESGRPVHIASSKRGMPSGAIVQAAGPWRTSGEWWTDRSWNRNEWDVALKTGPVCRIYQDRATDGWFFDGLYD